MKVLITLTLLAMLVATGCVSKSAAREQARMAYLQGQRDAFRQMQQDQPKSGYVTFIGPVKNHSVKWTDGMTLSQAIVKAGYLLPNDPKGITIRRPGKEIQVDTRRLLQGEVIPVQPGDVVEFAE